jgi:heme-degrading monooxygenase HmoA
MKRRRKSDQAHRHVAAQRSGRRQGGQCARAEAPAGRPQRKIPGLLKLEVGIDFSRENDSSDVVLYSEFDSNDALQAYQAHPAHAEVVPFVKSVRAERRVVDYTT